MNLFPSLEALPSPEGGASCTNTLNKASSEAAEGAGIWHRGRIPKGKAASPRPWPRTQVLGGARSVGSAFSLWAQGPGAGVRRSLNILEIVIIGARGPSSRYLKKGHDRGDKRKDGDPLAGEVAMKGGRAKTGERGRAGVVEARSASAAAPGNAARPSAQGVAETPAGSTDVRSPLPTPAAGRPLDQGPSVASCATLPAPAAFCFARRVH